MNQPHATGLARVPRQTSSGPSQGRYWPAVILCLAMWLLGLWVFDGLARHAYAAVPDSTDEALRKICQRGLAASAAEYCRQQSTLHLEQAAVRSRWIMRQMECQSQAALQATSDAEKEWTALATIESDYRREFPQDPRLPWLAWQLSRGELLRSQQALARWLATPTAEKQRELALQGIRRMQSQLDALEADIKARLPLSLPKPGVPPTQAPGRELQELAIDAGLLRCEALLVRARLYPVGSPDRVAALAEAGRTATDMLTRAQPDWPSRDELMVTEAAAGLEVGQRTDSLQRLSTILIRGEVAEATTDANSNPNPNTPAAIISPRTRMRAGTLAIEALCVDKNVPDANRLQQLLAENFSGPEVDLCRIQIQLAELEQLPPPQRPAHLKTIVEAAQELGTRYGAYWRNRGEALLVASASSSSASSVKTPEKIPGKTTESPSVAETPAGSESSAMNELLRIEVKQLIAGGQTSAAITKLRTTASAARTAGRPAQALALALEAARLMQGEKQWLEITDMLEPLALDSATDENAATAHALAAWALAQALQAPRGTADQAQLKAIEKRYEQMLVQQLQKWPLSLATLKAEEYLVGWYSKQKRFDDLGRMWLSRARQLAGASQNESALSALNHWLGNLIGRLPKAQVSPQIELLNQAITANEFSSCQRSAVIVALTGLMLTTPVTQPEAELISGQKVPGHLLEQSTTDQAALAAINALAAARRGDAAVAHSSLKVLDQDQLPTVVRLAWCKAMAEALDELTATAVPAWQSVLELIEWPGDAPPTTPALRMADLRLKQLRSRDREQANQNLSEIKQLASQHAGDANLQLSQAAAIAQSDPAGTAGFDEAVRIIKRVAAGTSKQSDAYLRARWLEIQWRAARGDKKNAAQIASLTLAGHKIETAWWRARFENASRY